jgi:predicted PurR-regulated permease PerM
VTDKEYKLPFFLKASIFLIGIIALFAILYIAKSIIVPIIFAVIIAIVLHPVVNFFVRKKINRIVAISITIFLTLLIIAGVGLLLFSQASRFGDAWPVLVDKFTATVNQSIAWVSGYFDINPLKIQEWVTKTKGEIMNMSSTLVGQTLVGIGNGLVVLFLIPVYIFLLLYYHPLILDFIHKIFGKDNRSRVNEIVTQIKTVIQRYLIGLIIEFVIVAVLNSVGLLILGIDYAILLGVIGAALNVIPYIGGIIGVAIFAVVALVTKSPVYVIYVLVLYSVIQFVDNNYIVPKIVSSKVKINALFSVIIVIAGNALWGISGMFLSIPLLAIAKLIFDHIEHLKPWGFLLGDTMPPGLKIKHILKKFNKKSA